MPENLFDRFLIFEESDGLHLTLAFRTGSSPADKKERYILVESRDRGKKEKAIRLGKLRRLSSRLKELEEQKTIDRDKLLKKIGAAEKDARRFARLLDVRIPDVVKTL